MTTENPRWTPILPTRGNGMLIDGNRIGLYAKEKMIVRSTGKETHWGVMYLMITESEWAILRPKLALTAHPPHDITFVSDKQPNQATVSQAYLAAFAELESDNVWFIGWATAWGPVEISHTEMQIMILEMADWLKANV